MRVWGGVPSKDAAQVLQIALIALLVLLLRALLIIVAQMMYYIQCTLGIFILISVILMAHTHTLSHSQTLAYRQAMKVIFHAMCDTRNAAFGFGDERTICSEIFLFGSRVIKCWARDWVEHSF